MNASIENISLSGANEYELPEFFDGCRVQAHTRMSLSVLRKYPERFYSLADNFDQLGVKVFVRHIKSRTEGAWWPSKLENIAPQARKKNIAKIIIDNAHRNGQRLIAYHRHMEDKFWCKEHPDWMSRMPDGSVVVHNADWPAKKLCFNSPYADAFLVRALELVDMGVDGFYFDSWHQSKVGCWCRYCREKFKQETGLDLPKKIDLNDPVYIKLLEYKNIIIERTFLRYREEFHKRNPNLVMIVGSNTWPSMADLHMTNRLWRIADIQKTEFRRASIIATNSERMPFYLPKSMAPYNDNIYDVHGWVLARDATGGRPPHIWTHGLLNEASALYATAGMVGHGCIANLDHREREIPEEMFRKSYELGNKVSPYFAGTKPLRWAAIHYSEHARNAYIGKPAAAWSKVLYPHYGAFAALLASRLPVGIVTDSQLEDNLLDGYRVLFVSDAKKLTEKMKGVIKNFMINGGQVVYNSAKWKWHEADGQKSAAKKFLQAIKSGPSVTPVRVVGGPKIMQADSFINKKGDRLVVTCINDFSWVWTGTISRANPDNLRRARETKPPKSCSGVKIILTGKFAADPGKVFDAVTGKELNFSKTSDSISIKVPDFEAMAVVVIEC